MPIFAKNPNKWGREGNTAAGVTLYRLPYDKEVDISDRVYDNSSLPAPDFPLFREDRTPPCEFLTEGVGLRMI